MTPKLGPSEGSRIAMLLLLPLFASAWASPTVVVVFPSPAGVGVIAVTRISLPSGLPFTLSQADGFTFALYLP